MPNIIINCDHIQFIPSAQVATISGTTITPKEGFEFNKLKARRVIIEENSKHTTAGDLISQTLQVDFYESTQVLNKLLNLPQIAKVSRSDGSAIVFGTVDNPALVSVSGININSGQVKFTRQSTRFEYISQVLDQYQ